MRLTLVGAKGLSQSVQADWRLQPGTSSALTIVMAGFLTAAPATQRDAALDVASIRENKSGAIPLGEIEFQPGRLHVTNSTIEQLVAWAHGLMSPLVWDRLMVGWPDGGIKRKGFDVVATLTTAEPPVAEQRRIVLDLLATRFGFKMHTESRPMDVFTVTLVKDGVLGPNLKRVDFNCFEMAPADRPRDKDGSPLCQRFADIEQIIASLNIMMPDRVLVNATGLQGYFVLPLQQPCVNNWGSG